MKWKSISRISMVVIPVVIVCGLLVPASSMGPTARADNEDKDKMVCTDKTIQAITEAKLKVRSSAPICRFVE
jgi:hypothetical protein